MNSIAALLAWVPSGWELILILLIVVLLFGAKKLPELAKGIGQSIKEFKKGAQEDGTQEKPAAKPDEVKKDNGQK